MEKLTKKIIILIIAIAIPFNAFAKNGKTMDEKIENKISKIKVLLKQIEKDYISAINYRERRDAVQKMDEVKQLLDRIENIEMQRKLMHKYRPQAMRDSEFDRYFFSIKNEKYISNQMKFISLTANQKKFSIGQLIKIIELFPFDKQRLQVINDVYPNVVNKERSYILFKYLKHNSSNDRLESIISRY